MDRHRWEKFPVFPNGNFRRRQSADCRRLPPPRGWAGHAPCLFTGCSYRAAQPPLPHAGAMLRAYRKRPAARQSPLVADMAD